MHILSTTNKRNETEKESFFSLSPNVAGEKTNTEQKEAGITTTSEGENESLLSFFLNAVGAKPASDNNEAGFTLVELIIAIAIFALVATAMLASLLAVVDTSRQQQAKSEAVDNLNYVVDDMVRRIRTGYNFGCGVSGTGDCPSGDTRFSFTSSEVGGDPVDDDRVTYRRVGDHIERTIDGTTERLTGPPLEITMLAFYVIGTDVGRGSEQSRVQLVVSGEVDDEVGDNPQRFSIQTTISQRLLYAPSE